MENTKPAKKKILLNINVVPAINGYILKYHYIDLREEQQIETLSIHDTEEALLASIKARLREEGE